ncbi:hypothetical protein RN001_012961 [Aquatica leii]|uniref:Cytochrome P450 n=1 Tax=Aquatica leii TaxID=1421715 RepID=A0AAN7S6R8_9COLE|nr:hypothetical protein RN001_012961 [Aquatica leii]
MWMIILLGALVALIYHYGIKPMSYWKNKNVIHEKPVPLFGSMLPLALRTRSMTEIFSDLYVKYKNERYFGMFNFKSPLLVLCEPDLIKTVFVKEFDTFPEHRQLLPKNVDQLWSKNLFAMEGGEEWHDLRSTLSPSFTSSKMKGMFGFMKECSQQFSKHFIKSDSFVEVELKDTFTRFANDVIATTAFGITCNSLSDPKNEFYVLAKELSSFTGGIRGFIFMLYFFAPSLAEYIKIPMFSKKVRNFFTTLVKDAVKLRREKGIVRPDMLHLLMEAQKGQLKYEETDSLPEAGFAVVEESEIGRTQKKHKIQMTDEVITAQVLIFFFAGFDTVSTMLSYACYELALNPDVQDKLREEVDETLKDSNEEFTYDNITNMKYLDMVISETLRKWPPFPVLDRRSVKPFTIEPRNSNERRLDLEKGSVIICPVGGIHLNPKYYPNPNKFDPERFNDENRHNILPYTYLPFGAGPRNCIGSRFALLEGKLVVAEIVRKFEICPVEKTQIPIVFSKRNFNPVPDEGFWFATVIQVVIMWIEILLSALVASIYYYVVKPMSYWKNKNVIHEKPVPLFGTMLPVILRTSSNIEVFSGHYHKYKNERYFGIFNFKSPLLVIRDPDLIKTLYVKEFDTFPEHRPFLSKDVDPLWSKNLFAMEGGEEWHDMRSTLSPSFTSSKMKAMFGLMKECSEQFSKHFSNNGDLVEVELKDTFARFANDVIATTAFGVTCNSFSDPNNEFYVLAKELNKFSGIKGLIFLLNFFAPSLAKYIRIPMFSKKVRDFFTTLVKDTINLRREKGIVRPDMLHLLMEAQKGQLKYDENNSLSETGFAVVEESEIGKSQRKHKVEVTDEVITAQVLIFFFAGFDTVSTMMSYACYELAINPDIQDKLREEVDETLKNSNKGFTYDNITNMKYLDMVISETLRKWPPFIAADRRSVKPFTIEPKNPGENPVHLEKGSVIICPIHGIHSDPKYYPNPEKFDPERFSDENKHNILPYTYLPFGVGPRNCIGSRFALLEGKLIVAKIISKFEIVPIEKTQIPIVFSKSNFNPLPDNGIWVGLKRRME